MTTETPIINNEATLGADIERLSEQRLKTLTMAKMLIQKAQKKHKDVYDLKHSLPNSFSIGEFVLIKKDFKRKKRAGGKLETQYVGPYMIMKIHGKGFYRLKQVGNEECVVERINGAHLKPYQVADESSEVRNTVEKGKVCNKDLDKLQSEEIEVDKLDHDILWEQLFSSNLMRLWRTGACELLYDSKEDDEALVSCEMYTGIDITYIKMQEMLQDFKAGEFALSQDTTVSLWKEYRIWYGEIPLQETCGGSFVVIDEDLYEELDAFKKKLYSYVDKSFSIFKAQELLHVCVQDNSKVTAFARKYILSNVTITLGCILSVGDF